MAGNPTTIFSARRIVAPLLGAALSVAAISTTPAAGTAERLKQLVGEAVSVSGAERGGRIDIYIEQWSSDGDLERMREALRHGDPLQLLAALRQQRRRAGVILMPGVQAHGARARTRTPRNLLFAREVVTSAGRQVIAASDQHLGLGEPALDARRSVPEFNLIDIRFDAGGTGVGKIASAADVGLSLDNGMLEVKNYVAQPARLLNVTLGER